MKLHQGSIEAMNRTDRVGSRLVIRIPQGKLHVPFLSDISETALVVDKMKWVESEIVGIPVSAEKKEERIATRNKANLLIVEDDMDICDYLLHELSDDYRVKVCHNGREAYELIDRKSVV